MNLPRSSFYYKPKTRELSPEDQALEKRIEEITEEFPKAGYRKVTRQFHREGNPVNHKKVHRVMREKGLLVKKSRRLSKPQTAPCLSRISEPDQEPGSHQTQSGLGCRYYVYPDRNRFCLLGRHSGPLLPESDRIRHFTEYRHCVKPRSAPDGDPEQKSSCRRDSSLGPGGAVCRS